jgi:hypothetical protein
MVGEEGRTFLFLSENPDILRMVIAGTIAYENCVRDGYPRDDWELDDTDSKHDCSKES